MENNHTGEEEVDRSESARTAQQNITIKNRAARQGNSHATVKWQAGTSMKAVMCCNGVAAQPAKRRRAGSPLFAARIGGARINIVQLVEAPTARWFRSRRALRHARTG